MRSHVWSWRSRVVTAGETPSQTDLESTARYVEILLDSGVSGLVMLGSRGENAALEPEEECQVMRTAVKTARGRVPILSGVSENSTAAAIRHARDTEVLGADGLMLLRFSRQYTPHHGHH